MAKKSTSRILNCIPSRKMENDWQLKHALSAKVMSAPAKLPAAKDLREDWWSINDQGATGSCVGWSCADSVLRWHFVKAGRLKPTELLSVRFIWMASKELDEFRSYPSTFLESDGTSLKAALDVARKFGGVRDKELPFASGVLADDEPEVFFAKAAEFKIRSYFNLGRNPNEWRKWLATQGPILTRLDVDDAWMNLGSSGKLPKYDAASGQGGHAVAIVGYQADGSFIIRNSWGTTWGAKGFAFASQEYAQAAFTEAFGVVV